MANGNLPPGVNPTPFDIDPQLGTHILDAVLAGVQQKKEEAASKLAEKHKQIDEKLSLIGELFRTNPAGALKLAQMDPSLAAMVPGIKDIPAPPPSEQQQREQALGQLTPEQRQQVLVPELNKTQAEHQKILQQQLDQYGSVAAQDPGFRRQYKEAFGHDVPSGPTLAERGQKLTEAEIGLRKKEFNARMAETLAGGYQVKPGVDAKVGQASLERVIDAVQKGNPILPADAANVMATDNYVKMMTAKHTISPASLVALQTLSEINRSRGTDKKTGRRLPISADQKGLYDISLKILQSDLALQEALQAHQIDPTQLDPSQVDVPSQSPQEPGFFDNLFSNIAAAAKSVAASGLAGGGSEAATYERVQRSNPIIEGVKRRLKQQGRTDTQIAQAEQIMQSAALGEIPNMTLDDVVKELSAVPTETARGR